jgi:hypothetical protein
MALQEQLKMVVAMKMLPYSLVAVLPLMLQPHPKWRRSHLLGF